MRHNSIGDADSEVVGRIACVSLGQESQVPGSVISGSGVGYIQLHPATADIGYLSAVEFERNLGCGLTERRRNRAAAQFAGCQGKTGNRRQLLFSNFGRAVETPQTALAGLLSAVAARSPHNCA